MNLRFDTMAARMQISDLGAYWAVYNPSKPNNNRQGLSLTSLDGELKPELDLNSLREVNLRMGTSYDEMSFRLPTKLWSAIPSISSVLEPLLPLLGRSHLIRLGLGGFFPPHRDLGDSFRLISIISGTSDYCKILLDEQSLRLNPGDLYFLNTKKTHSVFCMEDAAAILLVLNVELTANAVSFVYEHLADV